MPPNSGMNVLDISAASRRSNPRSITRPGDKDKRLSPSDDWTSCKQRSLKKLGLLALDFLLPMSSPASRISSISIL